ncbi:MAG: TIR domain-containing protein [Thioploca sp.]|nr:TIR domain-containing protein [Thioploca sp.]
MTIKLKVFISYVDPDQEFKQALLKQLAILQRQGAITTWDKSQPQAHDDEQQAIQMIIEECQIALLLLSEDYLAADFTRAVVLPRLFARKNNENIRILPIIVRPCEWETIAEMKNLTVMPENCVPLNHFPQKTGERAEVWTQIADQINHLVQELQYTLHSHTRQKVDLQFLSRSATPFIGRIQQLTELDTAFNDKNTSVIGIIGASGIGKSALVNEWLKRMEPSYNGAQWVFGWSFYSQGNPDNQANASDFFNQVLTFLGHNNFLTLTEEGKAHYLLGSLQEKKGILVLDGLEPLQMGFNNKGKIVDLGLKTLLSDLQKQALGKQHLIIITSQRPLVELAGCPFYKNLYLEKLTPGNGASLLKSLNVQGSPWQLTAASQAYGGHTLALVLLAHLLSEYYSGDIRRHTQLAVVATATEPESHVLRTLCHYNEVCWNAEAPERRFLYLLSLFNRPMKEDEKQILLQQATVAKPLTTLSESAWKRLFNQLRKLDLLLEIAPNKWDTHPLIRHYFREQFRQADLAAWQQAHSVLFEYFHAQSAQDNPDTLSNRNSFYQAVHHALLAGQYQPALQLYQQQVVAAKTSRFFAQELTLIAEFFTQDWNQTISSQLSSLDQSWLLTQAAWCLKSLGCLSEAVVPQQINMHILKNLAAWEAASQAAEDLIDLLLPQGLLAEAKYIAKQTITWAELANNPLRQIHSHIQFATTLYRLGELVDNVSGFQFAEVLQSRYQPQFPQLYARAGVYYGLLLLERAKDVTERETVLTRVQHIQQVAEQHSESVEIALARFMVGRVLVALHRPTEAEMELQTAISIWRESNNYYDLPEGLLTQAKFYRDQGQFSAAQQNLDDALDIIKRYGMQLYEAEAYLLQGHLVLDKKYQQSSSRLSNHSPFRLLQADNTLNEAEQFYHQAARLIKDMDYGLRIAELSLLAARLAHYAKRHQDALTHLDTAKQRIQRIKQWGLLPQWERVSSEIC